MKNIYLALVSILLLASCEQEPGNGKENKIKVGSLGFHVSFVVPNDATERMDQFITTHQQFMRETHHLSGDQEPIVLSYSVFKSPELNNPFDPSSGETGNTLYGLTEIYNGPEGVQAHMTLGQQREAMFAELVSLTNTYSVAGILGAPVIAAME
jgi:hypothetical protein